MCPLGQIGNVMLVNRNTKKWNELQHGFPDMESYRMTTFPSKIRDLPQRLKFESETVRDLRTDRFVLRMYSGTYVSNKRVYEERCMPINC